MSSPSPPSGSFGDQLLCPVCFEMFEGRILQCSQGHSVCEGCVRKINRHLNNECPQCRGAFVGTRNYILEEMVKQLKHLKASVMVKKTEMASTSDSNANTVSADANSDSEDAIDDAKLTKAIATLVASIPKPSKRDATTDECRISPQRARVSVTMSPIPDELNIRTATTDGPPQPRGVFSCRIQDCIEKLPVCRMLNHIRTFHMANLTENRLIGTDDEFLWHYTFKCQHFRQCIRIAQYGLFFLIVNVNRDRDNNKTIITSWVQCVGRSNECKLFTFNLQMRIGNAIAHFTDYTYGETSEASYIEQKKQCLYYETNMSMKRIKEIAVDVKISKSIGERTGRRRTTTTVVPISN